MPPKSLRFLHRLLLVIFLILLVSLTLPSFSRRLQKIKPEVETLATSDGEITIITPENITYTGPMTGYFPATYGFESDSDGVFPSSLTNIGTYSISVISSRNGHNKVVWFDDNGYSYRASCDSKFGTNITHGTIELWFLIDDASDRTGLILRQDTNDTVNMGTRYDKWKYHTPTEVDLNIQKASGGDMDSPLNNIWHHVRIAFEATTGNYLGLEQYTWKCWIDGIESATMGFRNNKSYVDNFYMSTSWAHTSYNMYIDAIGYSWDAHYNVGDNLNEGLLLDYDNSTNLDWKGYSLDGNANITIMGDTVFNMPEEGLHSIQMFGNNTLGTMYSSNLRYFSTNSSPQIITPQNKTYNEPMTGYYPGTYGFEDTLNGQDHPDWNDISSQNAQIVSEIDGHKKVYQAVDNSGSGAVDALNFYDIQSFGTVEFWCRFSSASMGHFYHLRREGNPGGPSFKVETNRFQYGDELGYHEIIGAPTPEVNKWYHIRVDFRGSSLSNYQGLSDQYTYFISINGEKFGSYNYPVDIDIGTFHAHTGVAASGLTIWWDAVSYSWDPAYSIGDNRNEGLLLSYLDFLNMDWEGYSLDNQPIKTILGNSTIALPSNGLHSIQVFGNDSFGEMYESTKRFFTVNISHSINITSPEDRTYIGPMAGHYPATYGFEDNTITNFVSLANEIDTDTDVSIVSSLDLHKSVLKLADHSSIGRVWVSNIFTDNQSYGFIEFWVRTSVNHRRSYIKITEGNAINSNQIDLSFTPSGTLDYYDTSWHTIQSISLNEWYHFRIEFNCSAKWNLWVDGVKKSDAGWDYWGNPTTLGHMQIVTDNTGTNWELYYDAIGYSWDPNYKLGDNLNEGLLLSYENTTRLDWKGYSLDGQQNKTIMGSTTIPLPSDGSHTIQVFGNDTTGTIIKSNLRYFTIRSIRIVTPENKTHSAYGIFPATYGFEADTIGSDPLNWLDTSDPGCDSLVVQSKTGHNKVVQMVDTGSGKARLINNFPDQGSGAIEFWYLPEDATTWFSFRLLDIDLTEVRVEINVQEDKWKYSPDGATLLEIPNVSDPQDNIWQHVRIHFETTSGGYHGLNQYKFEAEINGVSSGELPFQVNGGAIDRFYLSSPTGGTTDNWVDAVGFSWDPSYTVGDNVNEGLILSYENITTLDWQGYSLDGLANKTIAGNSTITLPNEGIHTIQIFANDSLGEHYESDIMYFTVSNPPEIIINSPVTNTLSSANSPNFNVSITDMTLEDTWYSLDGGITNIFFGGSVGIIDQTEWDKMGNGTVIIKFYANDSWGGINYEEVSMRKDVLGPVITINSPASSYVSGIPPPQFSLSIFEFTLDDTWYSLDNGITNVSFSGLTGTINQGEWDKMAEGTVQIRFFANDSLGNENFADITVIKDITHPFILINTPSMNEIWVDGPPDFTLSITELHLTSTWYTIDAGITNITFTGTSGIINQNEWNKQADGSVVITFYARDEAGHESYSEVRVYKETSAPIDDPNDFTLVIVLVSSIFSILAAVIAIVVYRKVRAPTEGIKSREAKPRKPKEEKLKKKKRGKKRGVFICPYCQTTLARQTKFCTYCGTNLQEENQ